MIVIDIPGHKKLALEHLVLDYNGTLACDGKLCSGVKELLNRLAGKLAVHVLTADTFGTAGAELKGIACELFILPVDCQEVGKLGYVKKLDAARSVCVGNGRNDRLMLKEAALGIAVILDEGAAVEALTAADVVCAGVVPALELLCNPLRLVATLRS